MSLVFMGCSLDMVRVLLQTKPPSCLDNLLCTLVPWTISGRQKGHHRAGTWLQYHHAITALGFGVGAPQINTTCSSHFLHPHSSCERNGNPLPRAFLWICNPLTGTPGTQTPDQMLLRSGPSAALSTSTLIFDSVIIAAAGTDGHPTESLSENL